MSKIKTLNGFPKGLDLFGAQTTASPMRNPLRTQSSSAALRSIRMPTQICWRLPVPALG